MVEAVGEREQAFHIGILGRYDCLWESFRETRPKPRPQETCPLIQGRGSSRRSNPVIKTGAGVLGPWCLVRDALSLELYARNSGLDQPLADRGALCVRFNSSGIRA